MEIELPYINLSEPCEFMKSIQAHDICPTDGSKRLRVLKGQLMDTVLENLTLSDYMFHVSLYFRYCYRLANKYPEYFDEIEMSTVVFWEKTQTKLKQLKEGDAY